MPKALAARFSDCIQPRLLLLIFIYDNPLFDEAATLVLYAAKDNEPNTTDSRTRAQGGAACSFPPNCLQPPPPKLPPPPNEPNLSLVRVRDREETGPGTFGILEPPGAEMVTPALLERTLICVPGVAFSLSGQRLGRGGGYYGCH